MKEQKIKDKEKTKLRQIKPVNNNFLQMKKKKYTPKNGQTCENVKRKITHSQTDKKESQTFKPKYV